VLEISAFCFPNFSFYHRREGDKEGKIVKLPKAAAA